MKVLALDLGNKQVKLKSEFREVVLPSHFVEASQYGDRGLLKFAKSKKNVFDFVSSKDPDFTYVWGKELDVDVVEVVSDTIGFGAQRYNRREFKLLADFALAYLAQDYEIAKTGVLEVAVVTGIPTSDYLQKKALDALQKSLKGDHNISINGKSLNIRVKKVYVLPQPVGTVLEQVMDDNGELIESALLNANIGVVDIGGGTVLIDALRKMNLADDKRVQLSRGAFTIYEAIVKELAKQGYTVNEYEIESVVRAGNEREQYFWSPDSNQTLDITDIVMRQRLIFTRNIISAIKTTYKGFGRMQTVLVTGGAANLILQKEFAVEIPIAHFVEDSEIANVRGFYKYALTKEDGK